MSKSFERVLIQKLNEAQQRIDEAYKLLDKRFLPRDEFEQWRKDMDFEDWTAWKSKVTQLELDIEILKTAILGKK